MSVITVGTMAFDAIETPFGKVDKIVGGSATYVALAASNFITPIQQISIVGYDFPQEEMDEMKSRGIQLDGVEIVPDKKSFFWSGKYHLDMNNRDTLVTDLNVLADFNPVVPDSYQGAEFLMLGNLMPKIQKQVIDQLRERPKLIVLDEPSAGLAAHPVRPPGVAILIRQAWDGPRDSKPSKVVSVGRLGVGIASGL